jgi:hypothetical protein
MSRLALNIRSEAPGTAFVRQYLDDTFLGLNAFRGSMPLPELLDIFPNGSGIKVKIECDKVVLTVDPMIDCSLDEIELQHNREYSIEPLESMTLGLGDRKFIISVDIY